MAKWWRATSKPPVNAFVDPVTGGTNTGYDAGEEELQKEDGVPAVSFNPRYGKKPYKQFNIGKQDRLRAALMDIPGIIDDLWVDVVNLRSAYSVFSDRCVDVLDIDPVKWKDFERGVLRISQNIRELKADVMDFVNRVVDAIPASKSVRKQYDVDEAECRTLYNGYAILFDELMDDLSRLVDKLTDIAVELEDMGITDLADEAEMLAERAGGIADYIDGYVLEIYGELLW